MRSTLMSTVTLLVTIALACSIGLGQTPPPGPPDKVEEDWSIVVASPNPNEVGPQITTCMSPVSDGSTPFVAFNLNYRDSPSFQPGGMQVKVCSNGCVQDSSSLGTNLLQTTNETITWTQRMSLWGGNTVSYKIVNGQSTTWGPFGSLQGLSRVSFTTSTASLASYSPDTSVANSGASWQSNRMSSMTLVRVRYYCKGQLISTDSNSRSVTLAQ
jgi:hypothetical protein